MYRPFHDRCYICPTSLTWGIADIANNDVPVYYASITAILFTNLLKAEDEIEGLMCYRTKQTPRPAGVCAVTVHYYLGNCSIYSYELWGGRRSPNIKEGHCSERIDHADESISKPETYRIVCYCWSNPYCAGMFSSFEEQIGKKLRNEDKRMYYQCFEDNLKNNAFLTIPALSTTLAQPTQELTHTPFETASHPKRPYLSEEAKIRRKVRANIRFRYLDWAIKRNLIILLVIAVFMAISGYFYYGESAPDLAKLAKKTPKDT
ncbi:unnamed protein product [Cylicocyclus nassatus]|uniref:Uncharacterized protein n=1 Tax=Cylicocyclus nassatus TaxID=53992 RepID=A0AA36DJE5_CYLNA|nr:unnamed protein product [Cylicocyclus nassatus]